jgi:Family of unknown function (DUF6600)
MSHTLNRIKVMMILAFMLAFISGFFPSISMAAETHVAVGTGGFKMLNQHGEWIQNERFGRVWRPHVVSSWRPYVYGEWISTDDGWFWDSYEPFGWVTYHYGRWWFTADTGWFWIPGDVWGPAWVSWANYDDYVGWAPLPPDGFYWSDPWETGPIFAWNVVFVKDFCRHEMDKHILRNVTPKPHDVKQVLRTTPNIQRIETASNIKIEKKRIEREKVQDENRTLERPKLPQDHEKTTHAFRERAAREILPPPPVAHKR